MDLHNHGASSPYVKVVIDVCGYQLIQKTTQIDMLDTSLRKSDTTTNLT